MSIYFLCVQYIHNLNNIKYFMSAVIVFLFS